MADGLVRTLFGDVDTNTAQNESMDQAYALYDWCVQHDLKVAQGVRRQVRAIHAELPSAADLRQWVSWFRQVLSSRSLFRRNLSMFMNTVRVVQRRFKKVRAERIRQVDASIEAWCAYELKAKAKNRIEMLAVTREVRAYRLSGRQPPRTLLNKQHAVYEEHLALETPADIKQRVVMITRRRMFAPCYRLSLLYRTRMAKRYPDRPPIPEPKFVFKVASPALIQVVPKFQKRLKLDQLVRRAVQRRTSLKTWLLIIVRLLHLQKVITLPEPQRPRLKIKAITRVLAYLFQNSRSIDTGTAPTRPECVDLLFSGVLQSGDAELEAADATASSPASPSRHGRRSLTNQLSRLGALDALDGSINGRSTAAVRRRMSDDLLYLDDDDDAKPKRPRGHQDGTPMQFDPDRQERLLRVLHECKDYIKQFDKEQQGAVREAISHLAVQQGRVVLAGPPGFRKDPAEAGMEGYLLSLEIDKLLRGEPSKFDNIESVATGGGFNGAAASTTARDVHRSARSHLSSAGGTRRVSTPTASASARRVQLSPHVYGLSTASRQPSGCMSATATPQPTHLQLPPASTRLYSPLLSAENVTLRLSSPRPPRRPGSAAISPGGGGVDTPQSAAAGARGGDAVAVVPVPISMLVGVGGDAAADAAGEEGAATPPLALARGWGSVDSAMSPGLVPLPPPLLDEADACAVGDALVCVVGACIAAWWGTRGRMHHRYNRGQLIADILASDQFKAARDEEQRLQCGRDSPRLVQRSQRHDVSPPAEFIEDSPLSTRRAPFPRLRSAARRATFRSVTTPLEQELEESEGMLPQRSTSDSSGMGSGLSLQDRRRASSGPFNSALFIRRLDAVGEDSVGSSTGTTTPGEPAFPSPSRTDPDRAADDGTRRTPSPPPRMRATHTQHFPKRGRARGLAPGGGMAERELDVPDAPAASEIPWDAYAKFFEGVHSQPLPEYPVLAAANPGSLPRPATMRKDDNFWDWWELGSAGLNWRRPAVKGKLAPSRPQPPIRRDNIRVVGGAKTVRDARSLDARRPAVAGGTSPPPPAISAPPDKAPPSVGKYLASFLNPTTTATAVRAPAGARPHTARGDDGDGARTIERVLMHPERPVAPGRAPRRAVWTVRQGDDWIQQRQKGLAAHGGKGGASRWRRVFAAP